MTDSNDSTIDNRLDSTGERLDDSSDADESHASTGGAAIAGAATGGLIGMAGGPLGAAVGAVGGAIVGAVSERVMHSDNDHEHTGDDDGHDHSHHPELGYAPGARDTMQLREEEISVQKHMEERGKVELGRDVVSERRSVDVPVAREEVYVERHPVERRPSNEPIRGQGEGIDVAVHEEEVTLEKRPVVYEEVSLGKRTEQTSNRFETDTLREVADVKRSGDVEVEGDVPRRDDRGAI